jgi:hypothetical protein
MNAIKALGQGFPRGAHAQRIALEEVIGLMRKELDETSQFTMKVAILNVRGHSSPY